MKRVVVKTKAAAMLQVAAQINAGTPVSACPVSETSDEWIVEVPFAWQRVLDETEIRP